MINGRVVIADYSSHSGRVDFQKGKDAGIDGVILRMYVRGRTIDRNFEQYYAQASKVFDTVGVFFNIGTIMEMNASVEAIKDYFPESFPRLGVWAALELNTTFNFMSAERALAELYEADRGLVGIYTAKWVQDRDDPRHLHPNLGRYPLWVADYRKVKQPQLPTYWKAWDLWQYSADGNGLGAKFGTQAEDIDLSVFWGDFTQFQIWLNQPIPESEEYIEISKGLSLAEFAAIVSDPKKGIYMKGKNQ